MLLKIKNLGNKFRTITSGDLLTDETTMVEDWEAYMWLHDADKKIEIVMEEPVVEVPVIKEEPIIVVKPKAKKKKK